LVDDLLVKADKMTMATSVELRVPFLDYRLVEAVAKLPSHYKCHKRTGKMLLKKMMEPYLPREIVHRTKMGFPVPTRDWFKGDLIPAIRTIVEGLGKTSWFKANNVLDNMLKRHQMGLDDHSKILMSLLVIDEWKKQYLQ
jgi:asparagine synthase (glutamine-hydrolysing)